MTERDQESGFEIVVDNRKRIIAFALIILICGCFFVWGFIAGKRQGMQLSAISGTDTATAPGMEMTIPPPADTDETAAAVPSLEEDAVQQDLDWYQSVNKKGNEPVGIQPPRSSRPAKETTMPTQAAASNVSSATATYSVQIGAFSQRQKAETEARNVRAKGFDSWVETPKSSGKPYRVKVGKFDTRAEAVVVQGRLRENGFSGCYVTTN
jgi:cell division protein FtsN